MKRRAYLYFILGILIVVLIAFFINEKISGRVVSSGSEIKISFEYAKYWKLGRGDFTKITGDVYNMREEAENVSVICYVESEKGKRFEDKIDLGSLSPEASTFFRIWIDSDSPAKKVLCYVACGNC